MPLFSRSSERKPRKTHRFSLRKHHRHSDADADSVASLSSSHSSHSDRKPRRQTQPTTREAEQTIVVPRTASNALNIKAPPSALSSSGRSSASTLRSTSPTLHENLSGGENDTEISEVSEESDNRESVSTPPQSRAPSMRNSRHSRHSAKSSRNNRNSLAEYRQLQCSMSYKNRVNSDAYRGTTTSSSDLRMSDRMSDMRTSLVDGFRATNSSVRSSDGHSLLNARISESSTTITSTVPDTHTPVAATASVSMPSPHSRTSEMSLMSPATSRMTEANVAALQTRRAFQQMVLAMEDEDSGDEYDSDSDVWRTSSAESSAASSGVSRKQADMEQTIEQEVQNRTQKVIEAMEKQISMYKQAKELECEREVQRRVSEHLENPRSSRSASRGSMTRRSSAYGLHTSSSSSSFRDSYNISSSIKEEGHSFEKLLHPRRSRKRLEQMKEREEAQKREMEQFREFIRTTEMRVTQTQGMDGVMSATQLEKARNKLEDLSDPLLPESLLQSPPSELIELICVLRQNGRDQEKQIEEAKSLVTAAIEAREDAETTAREAVELTLMLDARLERKYSTDEYRQSGGTSVGTPASSSAME
ncbi:uncharacterized protein PITG_16364 [Phytophthora infestans T30-4]|uniref:Uncharacterized protein n=1 Tax=Phytophthora infestans (strain T30-4) TaxID=403677 RepID=D0NU44_PHYIT|nr:uncharacterized protein PITG_16364 [Phytophthora infestans T30-4]EEY65168.1 conserved hypothetical protein [Phytophthora infestans T30-4]|eukprot:XP_002897425.1 conserved hypothetical protein [Phytophthora infestans T30-4]